MAALLSSAPRIADPCRTDFEAEWKAAHEAFIAAERRVELVRCANMLEIGLRCIHASDPALHDLLRAIDRLVRCPIPRGSRSRMEMRLSQKRKATRKASAEDTDWRELIAADAAALPAPMKRGGRA